MAPIIIGYWKTRALAQPIRMLLGYKKVDFVDKFYEVGDAPFFDKSHWYDVKYKMGFDFPNLPYIIDGDVKLTESNAIMRYLARKYNLGGETEEDHQRIDLMECYLCDLRSLYWDLTYFSKPQHFGVNLKKYETDIQVQFSAIDAFLGSERKFFTGDKLTYVDFLVYEVLEQNRLLSKDILKACKNLERFMTSFEEVPEIKEFMASDKCFKGPINNKYAIFRGPGNP